ncbi:MAG TPA: recombinase family protein [Symbiobacteriaceae bacterium]|nr:recombinase family protein [Symbiobacteriaceae bacterium]
MSTEEQEDSPLTQAQHTGEFLAQNGLAPWTRTYFDLGKSGGSLERRPGMLTMLAEAERLRPACIAFYRLDRAFRNAEEQAVALGRLKRLGVQILKVRDPNLQGPMGELIDGILGNINQFERQLTGMRIRDHNLAMAQRGEWPGGAPPFGYTYVRAVREPRGRKHATVVPGRLEPDRMEWGVARQIWDWALAGYRKVEIAEMANAAGYRRRSGAPWNTEALTMMLMSKTYAGFVPFARHVRMHGRMKRQYDRAEWYPGHHQALVTLDEWRKVQVTTNARMGQRRAHSRPRCELAGLIRCRMCGGPVVAHSYTRDGGYFYTCSRAAKREVDHPCWSRREWVIHMAILRVLDEVVTVLPEGPPVGLDVADRAGLEAEAERLRSQMKRQRALFELGEYGDDLAEYQRRRRALEAQVAALERQLASAGPSSRDFRRRWESLRYWEAAYEGARSVREKQRVWSALVEEVIADGSVLSVRLRDFGQAGVRQWELGLPPLRTRRPGPRQSAAVEGDIYAD